MMKRQPKREQLVAGILFWGIAAPIIFMVFFRLFFILFDFVYGFLILQIVGQGFAAPVTVVALITSLGFTMGVLILVHKQYKKHVVATF